MESQQVINIVLICLTVFLVGVSLSLLSSFYTEESLTKGVSETCSEIVIVSAFISISIFTPITGKYIMVLGTKNTFISGIFNVALGNISFGFLDHIQNKNIFVIFSIIICVLTALGVAALATSSFSILESQVSETNIGKVLSVLLSLFAIGTLLGPYLVGALYHHPGLPLTIWIIGALMLLLSLISVFYMVLDYPDVELPNDQRTVGWCEILQSPSVIINLFVLTFSSMGCNWYSTSLDKFLWTKYDLPYSKARLVIKLFTLSYSIITPIFGFITDHCMIHGMSFMVLGNIIIFITAGLLGPVPQLGCVSGHVWLTVVSVVVQGVGCSAAYLGSLVTLVRVIQDQNMPNSDRTKGMLSSLWVVAICSGAYLGSSLGGLASDLLGFEVGSLRITLGLGVSVIILISSLLFKRCCRRGVADEERRLLDERVA